MQCEYQFNLLNKPQGKLTGLIFDEQRKIY